jgi:hypothetical protein
LSRIVREIKVVRALDSERTTEKVKLFDADGVEFRFLEENSNEEG